MTDDANTPEIPASEPSLDTFSQALAQANARAIAAEARADQYRNAYAEQIVDATLERAGREANMFNPKQLANLFPGAKLVEAAVGSHSRAEVLMNIDGKTMSVPDAVKWLRFNQPNLFAENVSIPAPPSEHGEINLKDLSPQKYRELRYEPRSAWAATEAQVNSKANYRLAEQRQQERLAEFQLESATHDLSDSIALTKTLIESAANAGQMLLVKDLLGVLANLTKAHRIEQIRTGELLSKQAVRALGHKLAMIVAEEFEDVEGFEQRIDRVCERVQVAFAKAQNEEFIALESK